MKKIYLQYPYIKEIQSNILSRKLIDDKLHILCDKTIFIPKCRGYNGEFGYINGIKVLDVYTMNGETYHVLENKINTSKLHMKINWDNRYKLMQNNTIQYIISSYLDTLYSIKTSNRNILENYIDVTLQENPKDFDTILSKISILASNLITFGLNVNLKPCKSSNEESINVKISNLKVKNDLYPHVSNTSEIKVAFIKKTENIDGITRIHIHSGNCAFNEMKNIYESILKDSSNHNYNKNNISEFVNHRFEQYRALENANILYKERLTEALAKIINLSNENFFEIKDNLNLYDISRYVVKDNYTICKKFEDKIVFLVKNSEKDLKKFFSNTRFSITGSGSNLVYKGEINPDDFELFMKKIEQL